MGKFFFMIKSVAPLGIVPNLKGGLEERGLESLESWTPERSKNSSLVIMKAARLAV